MAADQPARDSGQEGEAARGLLFRIGARAAVVLFTAVLAVALGGGLDPTIALLRALLALLAITACGWVAEQVAKAPWRTESAGQAPVETTGEDA